MMNTQSQKQLTSTEYNNMNMEEIYEPLILSMTDKNRVSLSTKTILNAILNVNKCKEKSQSLLNCISVIATDTRFDVSEKDKSEYQCMNIEHIIQWSQYSLMKAGNQDIIDLYWQNLIQDLASKFKKEILEKIITSSSQKTSLAEIEADDDNTDVIISASALKDELGNLYGENKHGAYADFAQIYNYRILTIARKDPIIICCKLNNYLLTIHSAHISYDDTSDSIKIPGYLRISYSIQLQDHGFNSK